MKWRHSKEYQEQLLKAPIMCDAVRSSPFVGSAFESTSASANLLNNAQYLQFRSATSVPKAITTESITGNV